MPRNMSFMLTTAQIQNKTKSVTRRDGWKFLKKGEIINACRKCMGLKKGEKVEKLCQIQIVSITQEQLWEITEKEVIKEGFPDLSKEEFIEMFCAAHKGVIPQSTITRIEFSYL